MNLKSYLEKLSPNELEKLEGNFLQLRSICNDYNVEVAYFYWVLSEIESDIKSEIKSEKVTRNESVRKAKKPKNKPENKPEEIVVSGFKDFRDRNKGITADFNAFVNEVRIDIRESEIDLEEVGKKCSLEGYVSNVLYKSAESKKYERSLEDPVSHEDLEDILKIKFRDDIFKRISGILEPGYVQNNYVFDEENNEIKYLNSKGELQEDPNIEGNICFNGKTKKMLRKKMSGWVKKLLESTNSRIEKSNKIISEEVNGLESTREEYKENKKEFEELKKDEKKTIAYEFKASREKELKDLKSNIIDGMRSRGEEKKKGQVKGVDFEFTRRDGGKMAYMEVKFQEQYNGINVKKKFDKIYSANLRETKIMKKITDNIKEVNVQLNRDGKRRNYLKHEITLNEAKIDCGEKKIEDLRLEKNNSINYLGLEGPNFGSYLELRDVIEKNSKDVNLNGFFVEYNLRSFNLMESIMDHVRDPNCDDPKLFEKSEIVKRNIDDLILLDFPNDPGIIIPYRDRDMVEYKGEKISLDNYHELIEYMGKDGIEYEDWREIDDYNISEKFFKAIKDRGEKKFDVIFLDYVGGYDDRKSEVLRKLLERRLNDEAVIAFTSSTRFKQKGKEIDEAAEIIKELGYETLDNKAETEYDYIDKTIPMHFQMYHIKKLEED